MNEMIHSFLGYLTVLFHLNSLWSAWDEMEQGIMNKHYVEYIKMLYQNSFKILRKSMKNTTRPKF